MQAPEAEEVKKSQGAMDRRKTISALVHDQVSKTPCIYPGWSGEKVHNIGKIHRQALICILLSLQRKTGGRGVQFDLEQQFVKVFNEPCEL